MINVKELRDRLKKFSDCSIVEIRVYESIALLKTQSECDEVIYAFEVK